MIDRADEDRVNPRAPFNQPDEEAELEEYVVKVEFFVKSTSHDKACDEVELALSNINPGDFFEASQIEDVEEI